MAIAVIVLGKAAQKPHAHILRAKPPGHGVRTFICRVEVEPIALGKRVLSCPRCGDWMSILAKTCNECRDGQWSKKSFGISLGGKIMTWFQQCCSSCSNLGMRTVKRARSSGRPCTSGHEEGNGVSLGPTSNPNRSPSMVRLDGRTSPRSTNWMSRPSPNHAYFDRLRGCITEERGSHLA